MKKLFVRKLSVVLILALTLLAGCASYGEDQTYSLRVVCTVFPEYDAVRAIVGERSDVEVTLLLGPGQDSHSYDPTSHDIISVHSCDIFVYVGGESDVWVRDMLESVDTSDKTVISLMDTVDVLEEDHVGEDEDEHHHDHHNHSHTVGDDGVIEDVEYDEHVWTSPVNMIEITDALCSAMADKYPAASAEFTANAASYKAELESLDSDFRRVASAAADPVIVVADRFPLRYFCEEYGIGYYAAFSGCAASTEPSSATVDFLIDRVRELSLPVVFKTDMSSGNVAEAVAAAAGAEVRTFYSCHTITQGDFDAGEGYVSLMRKNLDSLSLALAHKADTN